MTLKPLLGVLLLGGLVSSGCAAPEAPAGIGPGPGGLLMAAAEGAPPAHPATPLHPASGWASRLVDPITMPYLFESPVVHTSVRPILIHHKLPNRSIFGGGDLKVFALQLRYAITDRLAFIAVKDGRADFDPDIDPGLGVGGSGWVDVAAGLKYAVVDDPESGTLVTAGIVYEGTAGNSKVLQGNGEGVWRPFVTAGWDLDEFNILASVGAQLPVDGDAESQVWDWHLHGSWEATEHIVPLIEINGLHYADTGSALPVGFEGVDYANIGGALVENNDVITGALGCRFRVGENVDLGLAWEAPLSDREDIFDERITLDCIVRF